MARSWFSSFSNKNLILENNYNSLLINLFINKLLKNGKKNIAEKILYSTLSHIKLKTKHPLLTVEFAIWNIKKFFKYKIIKQQKGRYIKKIKNSLLKIIKLSVMYLINKAKKSLKKINFSKKLAEEILKYSKFNFPKNKKINRKNRSKKENKKITKNKIRNISKSVNKNKPIKPINKHTLKKIY